MTNTANINTGITEILNDSHQLLQQGLYQEGFSHLVSQLHETTKELPQAEIDTEVRATCLQHPISKILMQEPVTRWSFQKPRGYSGDAILIDYMYRLKSCSHSDTYLGRELYGKITETPAVKALRWRSHHMAQLIHEQYQKTKSKVSVFSVASGHLRELAFVQNAAEKISRYVCLDQDIESNKQVRSAYNNYNFLEIIDESITHVIKRKMEGQKFDFIYSAGLFDYLNDKLASKMIERLYDLVEPGGTLMVPNYIKGLKEKTYMDTFMKWNLIYRDETDMMQLTEGLNIPDSEKTIYIDEHKSIVYLKIEKSKV